MLCKFPSYFKFLPLTKKEETLEKIVGDYFDLASDLVSLNIDVKSMHT